MMKIQALLIAVWPRAWWLMTFCICFLDYKVGIVTAFVHLFCGLCQMKNPRFKAMVALPQPFENEDLSTPVLFILQNQT